MLDKNAKPHLYVFAGANGSGKSTIIGFYLRNGLCPRDYICPDQLVPPDKKNDIAAYTEAMDEAERRRINKVALKKSFTFETVLSTSGKLDFVKFAKSEGYTVAVIYVTTNSPEINIERVKARTALGGHDVPTEKIILRYEKSMRLMSDVIEAADEALIYDNSGEKPIVVFAKYLDGRKYVIEPFPEWLKGYCFE
jgi:predicted ABC-type ATPase